MRCPELVAAPPTPRIFPVYQERRKHDRWRRRIPAPGDDPATPGRKYAGLARQTDKKFALT
jgi:hypothetical protein